MNETIEEWAMKWRNIIILVLKYINSPIKKHILSLTVKIQTKCELHVWCGPLVNKQSVSPFSPTHNHEKKGTERKYFLIYFLQNLANKGISSNTTYMYRKQHRFYPWIIRIWDAQNLMRPSLPESEYHQIFLPRKQGHFYKMLVINVVYLDYKMIWFCEEDYCITTSQSETRYQI